MKRSEINKYLNYAKKFFAEHGYKLPPWAFWKPSEWTGKGAEFDEIRDRMLGWDLTDFGSGEFEKTGLLLFTVRNGLPDGTSPKNYAEKIMIALPGQVTPIHFHWQKAEDIINRGGGRLAMRLWQATKTEELADTPLEVQFDGVTRKIAAGSKLTLEPGESVTLMPRVYHTFQAEGASCMIGEISSSNDDRTDNRFLEQAGRFPEIGEDEEPLHLLCSEYPSA